MGTIFKYNNTIIQCQNLQKKLKKLRLTTDQIEILMDDIPNDQLETIFVRNYAQQKKNTIEDNTDLLKPWVFYDPITKYSHIVGSATKPIKDKIKFHSDNDIIERLILLDGRPKYPIELGDDGLPIIEECFI